MIATVAFLWEHIIAFLLLDNQFLDLQSLIRLHVLKRQDHGHLTQSSPEHGLENILNMVLSLEMEHVL